MGIESIGSVGGYATGVNLDLAFDLASIWLASAPAIHRERLASNVSGTITVLERMTLLPYAGMKPFA
ncbi:MAG: hypothetical protein COW55_06620 [Rhodobacteraceae bacterium CG17_big_fil_post_rev_8_21_14_2_50_65_11]|nr:MAG: hypothetical protein COW55_06620 [Rhodobacteraceae bacterium CG17_big_fil_post_rev_8_21_14_2_50_65_11]